MKIWKYRDINQLHRYHNILTKVLQNQNISTKSKKKSTPKKWKGRTSLDCSSVLHFSSSLKPPPTACLPQAPFYPFHDTAADSRWIRSRSRMIFLDSNIYSSRLAPGCSSHDTETGEKMTGGTPEVRSDKDIPKISQRYPKVSKRYPEDIPKMSQRYPKDIPKIS